MNRGEATVTVENNLSASITKHNQFTAAAGDSFGGTGTFGPFRATVVEVFSPPPLRVIALRACRGWSGFCSFRSRVRLDVPKQLRRAKDSLPFEPPPHHRVRVIPTVR